MNELPLSNQFIAELKATRDRLLPEIIAAARDKDQWLDPRVLDSLLTEIIPDETLDMVFEGDSGTNMLRAIHTEPWLAVLWQLRKNLRLAREILSGEGQITIVDTQLVVQDAYSNIQSRGVLGMVLERMRIQRFPSLPVSPYFRTRKDISSFMEQYAQENDYLIEILTGGEQES